MILTHVMNQNQGAFTSVNSQMLYKSTFWTNRCVKDIHTAGEAVMCLVHWHVISPPRHQKDHFSHKRQSYKLKVVIVRRATEDLSAQT